MKHLLITGLLLASATLSLRAQYPNDAMGAVVKKEFIYPTQPLHSHGSSIVELPNGDLLSCWFFGTGERTANDVKIMGARLKKGASSWSAPFEMADTQGIPDCNPVLFLNHEGKLFLVWIAVLADDWGKSVLRFKTTRNYSAREAPQWEWQDAILFKDTGDGFEKTLAEGFKQIPLTHPLEKWYDRLMLDKAADLHVRNIGWMTRIKPLLSGNKRIILPLYSDVFNVGIMAISDDDGQSWRLSKPIAVRGGIQPALARRSNGDILAVLRGDKVGKSISKDDGETWTPATRYDLPSAASVELLRLKDGRFLMVYNDNPNGRNRLVMLVSTDEGENWTAKNYIESEPEEGGSFSYPALIQTADEMVHLTYSYSVGNEKTIRHVVIDPRRIKPTRVACHRGYTDGMAESTLAAFRKAVQLGADYIEIDVRHTRDDSLMILHDATLHRTTNGEGPINEKSYAEVRKLSAGIKTSKALAKEKVPTLEESCAAIRRESTLTGNDVQLYVDCKDPLIPPMVAILKKYGFMEQAVFYGNAERLAAIKALYPKARLMPALENLEQIGKLKQTLDPYAVDVPFPAVNKALVEACHREGIKVFADLPHELENREAVDAALNAGIDCIQTDRLTLIKGFVNDYHKVTPP